MNLQSQMRLAGCCFFGLSFLTSELAAQSSNLSPGPRRSGGWQATTTAAPRNPSIVSAGQVTDSGVQTAYFQAQSNLSDVSLPPFPGAVVPPPTGNFALPPFPPASQAPASAAVLPPSNSNISPPINRPPNSSPVEPPQRELRSQGATKPNRTQEPPAQLASTELRAIAPNARPQQSPMPNSAPAPRSDAQEFTSGLPYVTPPRSRYATSPYQPAVFQNADYRPAPIPAQLASNSNGLRTQLVAQQNLAPPTSFGPQSPVVPNGAAPGGALASGALPSVGAQQNLSVLPQNLPTNIYPTAYQCTTPAPSFPSTGTVPGAYIPPTLPPNLTPGMYTPNNAGYSPVFSLGQENYNVLLGRGIVGQPTVYVPGQPIRNFMRYLSP